MWKKLMSAIMSVVLVVGLCPGLAHAEGGGSQPTPGTLAAQGGEALAVQGDEGPAMREGDDPVSEFAYDGDIVNFIARDGKQFGMFTPQDGTAATIVGDEVVITYIPKNTTVYSGFHLPAAIDDAPWTDIPFIEAIEGGTYSFALDASYCGKAWPVAPIKKSDGGTTTSQYYLAIPTADKLTSGPSGPEVVELSITNNTGMFKANSARVEFAGDDMTLVMALSATGYRHLYKGTYEQAVANGDNVGNWVSGYQNDAGKWEFRIPIAADETYVPCVAISYAYYEGYLQGKNALARAFYPRQLEIDLVAKTLVTGDYEFMENVVVTGNVQTLTVNAAQLHTVGGPNSNNYKADLVLTMGSDAYSEAFVGPYSEAGDASATIALGEGNAFAIPVKWVRVFGNPETLQSLANGEPFYVSLKSRDGGTWSEHVFTLDDGAKTLVIDPSAADYTALDAALAEAAAIDRSRYTEESLAVLDEAIAAAVTGKFASQQAEVDAMVQAIGDAIAGLVPISPAIVEIDGVELGETVFSYNGTMQVPEILSVTAGGSTLTEGRDYTVAYTDLSGNAVEAPTNAGVYRIVVTGIGNFSGTKDGAFQIMKDSTLKSDDYKVVSVLGGDEIGSFGYTGTYIRPLVKVVATDGGAEYAADRYVAVYTNNVNVGTAKVTIVAVGNYSGVISGAFAIEALDIADAEVGFPGAPFAYTGSSIEPDMAVTCATGDGKVVELAKGVDYGVEFMNNTAVGTASAILVGTGNFEGVKFADFEIGKKKVAVPADKGMTYNGESQAGVAAGDDYTLDGTIAAVDAGSYTATAALKDTVNTEWADGTIAQKVVDWFIAKAANPITVTVKAPAALTFKTSAQAFSCPLAVSKAQGKVAYAKSSGASNFTVDSSTGRVTVKASTPAGTYTVGIAAAAAGDGNYESGSVAKTIKVTVKKAVNPIAVKAKAVSVKYSKNSARVIAASKAFTVSKAQGAVSYKKASGDAKVSIASNGTVTVAKGTAKGKHTVKVNVTAKGNANYNAKTVKNVSLTVTVN